MEHLGKKFSNAETTIDLINKKVDFNYPGKYYNENLCFFKHNFFMLLSALLSLLISLPLTYYFNINSIYNLFFLLFFVLLIYIVCIIINGYYSLLIHKYSKTMRNCFARTNAIFLNGKKFKIDLSNKYSKKYIIENNKLYILNYSIVKFNYSYIGDNPILKIETKCIEDLKKLTKIDPIEFICIITFKENIKDGILIYTGEL